MAASRWDEGEIFRSLGPCPRKLVLEGWLFKLSSVQLHSVFPGSPCDNSCVPAMPCRVSPRWRHEAAWSELWAPSWNMTNLSQDAPVPVWSFSLRKVDRYINISWCQKLYLKQALTFSLAAFWTKALKADTASCPLLSAQMLGAPGGPLVPDSSAAGWDLEVRRVLLCLGHQT